MELADGRRTSTLDRGGRGEGNVPERPALEMPLTTYRLDLGPVREAAEQAMPCWP